ncbi:hypothetical protein [Spiroplasma taiwanense]|uniref:Transmembrane protein n=1 Tax=Spiroplasma taiwanense CT-1 TaxID=1276220 RepID=S5LV88_9MOLU|nr:hypothetical protein [Spiroplasma taiwanense]AGR41694.1 hypothetical protein STAIW_v1c11110 [Spiroplasma taiwanense CT-1]
MLIAISMCIIPILMSGFFAYLISWYILKRKIDFVKNIFDQEKFFKFPIILDREKNKIFIPYFIFIILNTLIFIIFCFIFTPSDDGYLQYMLLIGIIYIISIISIIWFIVLSIKKNKNIKFTNSEEEKDFIINQLEIGKTYEDKLEQINLQNSSNTYNMYLNLAQKRYIKRIDKSLTYEKIYELFLKYIRANCWILTQMLSKENIKSNIEINKKLQDIPEIIFKNFWNSVSRVFE